MHDAASLGSSFFSFFFFFNILLRSSWAVAGTIVTGGRLPPPDSLLCCLSLAFMLPGNRGGYYPWLGMASLGLLEPEQAESIELPAGSSCSFGSALSTTTEGPSIHP